MMYDNDYRYLLTYGIISRYVIEKFVKHLFIIIVGEYHGC